MAPTKSVKAAALKNVYTSIHMKSGLNIFLIIVAIIALAFGSAFLVSRYLVSKLDGRGTVQTPSMMQYSSEEGVSFMYPDTYELSSHTSTKNGQHWDSLVLLPKGYVAPQDGEGPPSITMSVFPNTEGLGLEAWIKNDARSNYQLSTDGKLTSILIDGEPALVYAHSGLYEADAIAVEHNGKIFLFEAGWQSTQDTIRADFKRLYSSINFL